MRCGERPAPATTGASTDVPADPRSGTPSSARQLRTPSALALADLAAIFDDLQFTLRCCERLLTELERDGLDAVLVESLWVSALNSYARCFRPGERGMGLTEKDLEATGVQGEVVEWHGLLGRIRDFSSRARSTRARLIQSAFRRRRADGPRASSSRRCRTRWSTR